MGVHTSIWQRVLAIMGLIWYHFQDDFFRVGDEEWSVCGEMNAFFFFRPRGQAVEFNLKLLIHTQNVPAKVIF